MMIMKVCIQVEYQYIAMCVYNIAIFKIRETRIENVIIYIYMYYLLYR